MKYLLLFVLATSLLSGDEVRMTELPVAGIYGDSVYYRVETPEMHSLIRDWEKAKPKLATKYGHGFDCTSFSQLFCGWAKAQHARAHPKRASLAIAEAWYLREDGTSHAVALFALASGSSVHIDPQNCRAYIPTPYELLHRIMVRW